MVQFMSLNALIVTTSIVLTSNFSRATQETRLSGELEGKKRAEVIQQLGEPEKKIAVTADDSQLLEVWYWRLKNIEADPRANAPSRVEFRQIAFRKGQSVVCSDGEVLGDNGREIGHECARQSSK